MFCNKCGNELKENEKFCGKCGQASKLKKGNEFNNISKSKTIRIMTTIILSLIIIITVILGGLYFYGKAIRIGNVEIENPISNIGLTDNYLTKNFKENGFDQFDDISIKILAIDDIEYNDFNKVILMKRTIKNQGITYSDVGLILANRPKDMVSGLTINTNLIYLINGIYNNNSSKAEDILEISAKYIKNEGTEIFSNHESKKFQSLIKELSNIVSIEQSRKYVKDEYEKNTNGNLECNLLFEKNSAYIKYIAFYDTTMKYNSSYPVDENAYNTILSGYSYKSTRDALAYTYGPAYSMIKEYTVYKIGGKTDTTEEFEKNNKVGTYESLDKARQALDVD